MSLPLNHRVHGASNTEYKKAAATTTTTIIIIIVIIIIRGASRK